MRLSVLHIAQEMSSWRTVKPSSLLITLACLVVPAGTMWAQTGEPRLDTEAARLKVGEIATVCGRVEMSECGQEMRLTLGPLDTRPAFRVLVPIDLRSSFGSRPEERFYGRLVCVRGLIVEGRSSVEVAITDAAALTLLPEPDFVAPEPFGAGAYRECELPGMTMPLVTHEQKPAYTRESLIRKVAGAVWLQAVVESTGRVGDIRVVRRLDRGLDNEAIKALRRWRFAPARHEGRAVPLVVIVEMDFTIRR